MAVYTVLERSEIEAFIEPFGIGPLVSFEGIADGLDNTNYFITTDQSEFGSETRSQAMQDYVLTIFEDIDWPGLVFCTDLTAYLNLKGLPVPCPITDSDGRALQTLQGKPATLIPKVPGEHPSQASIEQCRAMGKAVAGIHQACVKSSFDHPMARDLVWMQEILEKITPKLHATDQQLLADEIKHFNAIKHQFTDLPRSVIHGDLFRDNVLFVDNQLTGIIDFNSAGNGYLLYDLAIVANDWCSEHDGSLDNERCDALLASYQHLRPLSHDEKQLWNDFLRIAALRFWLSRLQTKLAPALESRPGSLLELKDPQEYKTIFLQRLHNPSTTII